MRILIVAAALILAGCASSPVIAPPQIVTVTKVQYVSMPIADLVPCIAPPTAIKTNADLLWAWQHALAALAVCNAQIADLRHLNDKVKP